MEDKKANISDEQLLQMFFEERRQDVADDGFTSRVMRRLPDRSRRLSRIWSAVCSVAAIVVLVVFIMSLRWNTLLGMLRGLWADANNNDIVYSGNPLMVYMMIIAATVMLGYGMVTAER